MEEVAKLLGPWPILQFMFGVGVMGFGVFMIVRGLQKKDEAAMIEDRYNERRALERLDDIHENSFKMVELLGKIYDRQSQVNEALRGLAAAIWNRREGV